MLHKYKVVKELGKGGFGRALLVRSTTNNQLKVAKEIDLSNQPLEMRKFALHEAEMLQTLKHTNIIKYCNCTKGAKKIFILMDYADGGDLDKFIEKYEREKKRIPEDKILDIFVQICLGIKYLHDRKILHRDLKPQNVFLTKNGIVKLGDFGISTTLEHTNDVAQTKLGTPIFCSPEICMGKAYNSKSDMWSLGCILYELITLRHAFAGRSLSEIAIQILTRSPLPMPINYSSELRQIVVRLLEKNPSKRPSINDIFKETLIRNKAIALLGKTLARSELSHDIFHGARPGETPMGQNAEIKLAIDDSEDVSLDSEKAQIYSDIKEMCENLQNVLISDNLIDVPEDISNLNLGEFYFMGRKLTIKNIKPSDPLTYKFESLRNFLEEMLGIEKFKDLYFKAQAIAQNEFEIDGKTIDLGNSDIYNFQLIMQLVAYENKYCS